jgi:hypothetical protein
MPIIDADSASEPEKVEVEPLSTDSMPGRVDARARFVADSESADVKPVIERDTDGAPEAVTLTAEKVADMAAQFLDAIGRVAGPRFVGGQKETWTLADEEKKAIAKAAEPVVEKYGASQLSPEALLLTTIAIVYLPRALAALEK